MKWICILLLCAVALPTFAQTKIENQQIDYSGFRQIVGEVEPIRELRRLTEEAFLKEMTQPGVVVLDARSANAYALRHLKGAISLPFTDFTEQTLAKVIPSKGTKVLIYCNNNFMGSPTSFPTKAIRASLNLSTYTSLHAYGYNNVHELGPALDVSKTALPFEGTEVAVQRTRTAGL